MQKITQLKSLLLVLAFFLVFFFPNFKLVVAAQLDFYDFNFPGDLDSNFTPAAEGYFSQEADIGLGDSEGIDIQSVEDLYTTTNSYPLPTLAGETLVVSTYFKFISSDSCCSDFGLGFVATTSSDLLEGGYVQTIEPGTGVSFVYNSFVNVSETQTGAGVSFPIFVPDQWYKVVYALVATGVADTYHLHTQIWNSDSDGNLYSLRAWRVEEDVLHETLSQDGAQVHAYFGATDTGSLFSVVDNFEVSDTALASLWDGDGTEESPYIINTCADLQAVNTGPDSTDDVYFRIGDGDIDCSETEDWNGGEGFVPLGADWEEFSGIFDGNYQAVTDLTINQNSERNLGLFASIDGEVKNLILKRFTITGGSISDYLGVLAGNVTNADIVQVGVEDSSIVSESLYPIGGLVGRLANSTLSRSYVFNTSVSGEVSVGGLVGYVGPATVVDSYASTELVINGSSMVGGLIGESSMAEITNTYTSGSITANDVDASIAGLVGRFQFDDPSQVNDSFSVKSFSSGDNTQGGLIGSSKYGDNEDLLNNFYYHESEELLCVGYTESSTITEPACTRVASPEIFKDIINEPLASWSIAITNDEDHNLNNGYPVLAWQVLGEESPDATWYLYAPGAEPSQSSHSSQSSKPRVRPTPDALPPNPPSASGDATRMMETLRELIRQFIAKGGKPSSLMTKFLTATSTDVLVRDLEYGMEGDDVRMLQTLLINQGYPIPAGATSLFLEQTRSALSAYQAVNGINPAQGYFGILTRTQMKNAGLMGLWW